MSRLTNGTSLMMPSTAMDKTKDWQLEILMEKLRSKSSQYKSLSEISKNVRMSMLDKRYALDSVDKSQHQKCLDTLQHSIKVTSLQSMVERLESLTRQLGLKFTVGPPIFISSDMFYLEIVLEQNGTVMDVKVHHEGKVQQSCAEIVSCLSKGDFDDFTTQLEGFASIYHLNAEKKIKEKAFTALQLLESDLSTLAQLQVFMKEPINLLHKSPVGILEKRRGGHPMKLTYFVSPYDLLNVERAEIEPLTVDIITTKCLGYSVTVCMEGSAAHKLQTTTLITVRSNNGKSTPIFSPLNTQNSAVIPACFVLKLNKPMPMCTALIKQIQELTELDTLDLSSTTPLLNLIVKHSSDGKLDSGNNKGLFVTLPDQNHCYFMTENKNMEGILVKSIPFTHPTHVSRILVILRQQALFNTIINSCVRPLSRQDFENMTMLEVSALSWTYISISLEHPTDESMATAEIDLSDITNLTCRIQSSGSPPPVNSPDIITDLSSKILNRCFSIPVTMRSVIKYWDRQITRRSQFNGHENFSLPLGSGDPGGHKGGPGGGLTEFGGLDKIKQEPSSNSTHGMMMQGNQSMFLNESLMSTANFPNFPSSEGVLSNIELTNILTGTTQADKLSKKSFKRKVSDEIYRGGFKRKAGEDSDLLLETSSSDSTSRSTPLSHDAVSEVATPNSGLGFQSDLELSALDATELLGSVDKHGTEFDNIDELPDVEDLLNNSSGSREHKRRKSHDSTTANLLLELGDKSLVPPNVSITPITTVSSPGFSPGGGSEKRTGIEIIPLATTSAPVLPSSITITPISSSPIKGQEEKTKEKKSSKNRSEDKGRLEKKRKRKRDESPMGPPEKIPSKQDPLTKPVSVSIKATESPPLMQSTPTSPSMSSKFNASPTHNRVSVSGKLSPNLMKSGLKSSSSSHHSPKHSPAHISSSPKHTLPGISSPKNHGTSPKHPSTSGSGKPSMSTLKSAANSPSSKSSSDSKSKSVKESSRDKDKKLSGVFNVSNTKTKSSTIKVKPLDLNAGSELSISVQDSLPSPGGCGDSSKSSNSNQRNRKGSILAIVDKLKSAQCDTATDLSSKSSSSSSSSRDRTSNSGKTSESKNSGKVGETKNSEYMVKHSSDGMKITINKTRSKESSSKSSLSKSSSGSGSPKTHTGLKPGVNSGPASKKPQQSSQKSSSSSSSINSTSGTGSTSGSHSSSQKSSGSISSKLPSSSSTKMSSSSSSLSKSSSSKLSGSPKTGSSTTDVSRNKDRPKINKSSSEKSIFSSKEHRKSSPTPNRDESDGSLKLSSSKDPYTSQLMMDGMIKQLDKNFQIPKLSARNSDDKKQTNKNSSDSLNNISRSVLDTKMFDVDKNVPNLPKYPLGISSKILENPIDSKIRNSINNISHLSSDSSPKFHDDDDYDKKKDLPQNLSSSLSKDDLNYKLNFPISVNPKSFTLSSANSEPLVLTKSLDISSKFIAPAIPKEDKNKDKSKSDNDSVLLDYSSSNKSDNVNKCGSLPFPTSPSVSVHIVKSPAPSPLINPSPHSASPCITDDELMDEALVGLGK